MTSSEAIAHRAVAEYQYRRGRGYKTYATADKRNEHLPHRRHVLKRFVSSILYLDVRQEESGRMVSNMVGMTAAAAAMLVATLAAVWTAEYHWYVPQRQLHRRDGALLHREGPH